MTIYDLNGDVYDLEAAIDHIFNKYGDDYDGTDAIRAVADHLNWLYQVDGSIDGFFLKTATDDYKAAYKALVIR